MTDLANAHLAARTALSDALLQWARGLGEPREREGKVTT